MCYIVLPVFWDAVVKVEINVALKNVKMIQWNASTVEKDLSSYNGLWRVYPLFPAITDWDEYTLYFQL